MTIPLHFPVRTAVPVYCIQWIAPDILVYAGGGGKSKTGVGNWLRVLHVPSSARSSADVSVLAESKLSSDEDSPMCMAIDTLSTKTIVLGINEVTSQQDPGDNRNLRIFSYDVLRDSPGDKPRVTLTPKLSAPSVRLKDTSDSYLRLISISPSSSQLIAASTEGSYAVQDYPTLRKSFNPTNDFQGEEIMDADFSQGGGQVVVCSGKRLKIFGTYPAPPRPTADPEDDSATSKTEATLAINSSLGLGPKSSQADVQGTKAATDAAKLLGSPPVWHTIQNPALGGEGGCEFRAVRFGRSERGGDEAGEESTESTTLFTVVNAKPSAGGARGKKRKSFLTSWSLPELNMTQTRQLSEKPVTTFAISPSGRLLAYGSSDLSVGVVDAESLRVKMRVLESHAFPATGIAWSPRARADSSSKTTKAPPTDASEKSASSTTNTIASSSSSSPQSQSQEMASWLASCSADGTLRLIRIPSETSSTGRWTDLLAGSNRSNLLVVLLLTLLILLLSMYVQNRVL